MSSFFQLRHVAVVTLVPVGCVAFLLACGNDSTGPAPIATITVTAPAASLRATETIKLTAEAKDAKGTVLIGRNFTWSSSDTSIASVALDGTVTGRAAGSVRITAAGEGKFGEIRLTVSRAPLASIVVTGLLSQLTVGQVVQASATSTDATGKPATDVVFSWSSTDPTVASITDAGVITARAAGTTRIDARAEGIVGSLTIVVVAATSLCSSQLNLSLSFGEIRTLSATEKSEFCLSATASPSEFAIIPFNNSPTAATTISVQINGTNVIAPSPTSNVSSSYPVSSLRMTTSPSGAISDWSFREREYRDLRSLFASRASSVLRTSRELSPSSITGVPATPTVGDVFPLNANLQGNSCTSPKQLHDAKVVAVLPHVIVFVDVQAPAGGYSDDELTAFGQAFENLGYGVDTLNFGSPTDIDENGRVAMFFTTGVNSVPGLEEGFIAGLQASRDLFPLTTCVASNEGEIFYLPVPDPASTINGNYTNKTVLANSIQGVLVHEFQHLINAGRRIYINDASSFEEIWLNEGLSHIAEELLYYQASGNSPRSNINLETVRSTQAQLDAINRYQVQNLARLRKYMVAPEVNSPYAGNDELETRGATWQLLRYAADRKGGTERSTWFSLVNSTASGQQNFNAVFGDIITFSRDWAVAQFVDDTGLAVDSRYRNPSWNFRSLMPAINNNVFPLLTRSLVGSPIDVSLAGGAAAYIRFQIGAGSTAKLTAISSGQPLPAGVDVLLVRTK